MLDIEVIVKGQVAKNWSEWFEGLELSFPLEGHTALTGLVEDQAALRGLLSRLWDLGLPVVSVWTGLASELNPVVHTNVRAIIERGTPAATEIVLQVRNKPHEGRTWIELPGGRVRPYESLTEALCREVREETGLDLTLIEGLEQRVEALGPESRVECLPPFAAYQTLRGPVDSLGIYFRCQAQGELLESGDATLRIQWVPVSKVQRWLVESPDQQPLSWVDRAGLLFYLKSLKL